MKKILLSMMTIATMAVSTMSASITEPTTIWEKGETCTIEGLKGDGNCTSNWGTALQFPGSAFDDVEDGCMFEVVYAIGSSSQAKFIYLRHPVYDPSRTDAGFINDEAIKNDGLSDSDINNVKYECQNEKNRRIYTARTFVPKEKVANLKKYGVIIKGGKGDGTGAMPFYIWQVNIIPVSSETGYPAGWKVNEVDPADSNIIEEWRTEPTWKWAEAVKFKKEAFADLSTPVWVEVNYESTAEYTENEKFVFLRVPSDGSLCADQDVQTKRFIYYVGKNGLGRSMYRTLNYIPLANVNLIKEQGMVIKAGDANGDNALGYFIVNSVKVVSVADENQKNDLWRGYFECSDNTDPNVPSNMLTTLGSSVARQLQVGDELRVYCKNTDKDTNVETLNLYCQNKDLLGSWDWYPIEAVAEKVAVTKAADSSYFSVPVTDDILTAIGKKANAFGVGNSGLSLTRVSYIPKDNGTGVKNIEVSDENAPVEYYNLQGLKVNEPSNGIYIKKQGTKVEKIVVNK